ncbi:MAG: hypothetical protein R3321_09985 [Nitrososphaeraceae archaeon]|nr:hypothetical protein [Nitrososphaeraceae archaeon]
MSKLNWDYILVKLLKPGDMESGDQFLFELADHKATIVDTLEETSAHTIYKVKVLKGNTDKLVRKLHQWKDWYQVL